MSLVTVITLVLFISAGIMQILYSRVASQLKNVYGLEMKLKKYSSYSYNRKHLKELKSISEDGEISKNINRLLFYENTSFMCIIGAFLVFILGGIVFGI